jgi:hypothetical protein
MWYEDIYVLDNKAYKVVVGEYTKMLIHRHCNFKSSLWHIPFVFIYHGLMSGMEFVVGQSES